MHIHRGILTQPGQKQYGSLYNNCCKQLQAEGLALTLFVFWILTDNADASLSLNDLALIANGFNRRSDFHVNPPFPCLPVFTSVRWVSSSMRIKTRNTLYQTIASFASKKMYCVSKNI